MGGPVIRVTLGSAIPPIACSRPLADDNPSRDRRLLSSAIVVALNPVPRKKVACGISWSGFMGRMPSRLLKS